MGVPPVLIHFNGIYHEINHPTFLGTYPYFPMIFPWNVPHAFFHDTNHPYTRSMLYLLYHIISLISMHFFQGGAPISSRCLIYQAENPACISPYMGRKYMVIDPTDLWYIKNHIPIQQIVEKCFHFPMMFPMMFPHDFPDLGYVNWYPPPFRTLASRTSSPPSSPNRAPTASTSLTRCRGVDGRGSLKFAVLHGKTIGKPWENLEVDPLVN